ncbi:hypothetical protein KAI58_00255 [Candidatus Gracilibacteria bacterium]|nr:hypothetical protein [Candidatus Gracilibacteria bacterium]
MVTKTVLEKTTRFATKHFKVGVISPLTNKRNAKNFFQACEAACELGFVISVLAVGDEDSQAKCFELEKHYPEQFEVLEAIPKNKSYILNHVDIVLFPATPSEDNLKKVMKKGIVPIMPYQKDFSNFDAQKEEGNAFLFKEDSFWELLATMIRAFENFKFSYDWGNLQKHVKKTSENI